MRISKQRFVSDRTPYHMDILRHQHPDAPDSALEFWAKDRAEKEYRTGRVYADPVQIEKAKINVYDPEAKFGSGEASGVNLRFNPAGPMVSIMSLSYKELRELVQDGLVLLKSTGEWNSELDDPEAA